MSWEEVQGHVLIEKTGVDVWAKMSSIRDEPKTTFSKPICTVYCVTQLVQQLPLACLALEHAL